MLAVGLMSGTSLDGIDAALIETDGEAQVRALAFRGEPFSDAARAQLAEATALALAFERPRASPPLVAAEELITRTHVLAVQKLLRDAGVAATDVGVIGFHGRDGNVDRVGGAQPGHGARGGDGDDRAGRVRRDAGRGAVDRRRSRPVLPLQHPQRKTHPQISRQAPPRDGDDHPFGLNTVPPAIACGAPVVPGKLIGSPFSVRTAI